MIILFTDACQDILDSLAAAKILEAIDVLIPHLKWRKNRCMKNQKSRETSESIMKTSKDITDRCV